MTSVTLALGGMSCASCAARIENTLNRIDGVSASVNFATEKAEVDFPHDVSPEDLVSAVEATGYSATFATVAGDAREARSAHLRRPPSPEGGPRQSSGFDRQPLSLADSPLAGGVPARPQSGEGWWSRGGSNP